MLKRAHSSGTSRPLQYIIHSNEPGGGEGGGWGERLTFEVHAYTDLDKQHCEIVPVPLAL